MSDLTKLSVDELLTNDSLRYHAWNLWMAEIRRRLEAAENLDTPNACRHRGANLIDTVNNNSLDNSKKGS